MLSFYALALLLIGGIALFNFSISLGLINAFFPADKKTQRIYHITAAAAMVGACSAWFFALLDFVVALYNHAAWAFK